MLRIGIVVGEASGDLLGAKLIRELKEKYTDIEVVGIGGKLLIENGCQSLFDMERLSVMGIFEIFGRLFELLSIRRKLTNYFIDNPPDVFIGIDAPEFNLTLEENLRSKGIKTVHYVSPSVWAWREYRIKKYHVQLTSCWCCFRLNCRITIKIILQLDLLVTHSRAN